MLQDKIDQFLLKKQAENKKKGISPSNLGSCPRKLYFIDKDSDKMPFTAQQLRVFEAGNLIEAFALNTLEDVIVEYQKTVTYKGISGTLDMIVKYGMHSPTQCPVCSGMSGGEDPNLGWIDCPHCNGLGLIDFNNRLIDIKSCNSQKFKYLDKEGADMHYLIQVTFYWLALKAENYPDLDNKCTIYYIEKDTLLTKEITFSPHDYINYVDARIQGIREMQKTDNCPCEKDEITWECFSVSKRYKTVKIWCNYIKHCPRILDEYHKACAGFGIEPDKRLEETNNEKN
jgi:hypothetical protein